MLRVIAKWIKALIRWVIGPRPIARFLKVFFGLLAIIAFFVVSFAMLASYKRDKAESILSYISDETKKLAKYFPAPLPDQQEIKNSIWLEQNWSNEDRFWFHHTHQGTATITVPYEWFVALDQPELFLFGNPKRLSDLEYLKQFGFIPSPSRKKLDKANNLWGRRNISEREQSWLTDFERNFGYRPPSGQLSDQASKEEKRKEREKDTGTRRNEGLLPVGFARLRGAKNPVTGETEPEQIGFTCAACHTGHLEYKDTSLRFDGGPAMTDLRKFESAVGLSIAYTLKIPSRFCRFADRVLENQEKREPDKSKKADRPERKRVLKNQLRKRFAEIKARFEWRNEILEARGVDNLGEGFGRLDALNRIGNQVFYENMLPTKLVDCAVDLLAIFEADELKKRKMECAHKFDIVKDGVFQDSELEDVLRPDRKLAGNLQPVNAPVSYPPLWGVSWFSWAQYDASVFNELVRNAGEALGVKAFVNLVNDGNKELPLFGSSVNLKNLYWLEKTLRGDHPRDKQPVGFKGLNAPVWPTIKHSYNGVVLRDQDDKIWSHLDKNWSIDLESVRKGREVYRDHCFECHRAPIRDAAYGETGSGATFWKTENPVLDNDPEQKKRKDWIGSGSDALFNVVQKKVKEIGTDPQQALVLSNRKIYFPKQIQFFDFTFTQGEIDRLGLSEKKVEELMRDRDAKRSLQRNPLQALNWRNGCGLHDDPQKRSTFALALMATVDKAIDVRFEADKAKPGDIDRIQGPRKNCPNPNVYRTVKVIDDPEHKKGREHDSDRKLYPDIYIDNDPSKKKITTRPVYRARPLDGVWATAPYLHNGSVPNLEDMLKPASKRTKVFCVGSRQFDPEKVGIAIQTPEGSAKDKEKTCPKGLTRLDTAELGNSNAGHSFEAGKAVDPRTYPPGVIGRILIEDEPFNLIQYLKTL